MKKNIYLVWWTINYIYICLIGDSIAITWQAFLQVVQNENPFTQPFFNKKKSEYSISLLTLYKKKLSNDKYNIYSNCYRCIIHWNYEYCVKKLNCFEASDSI